MDGYFFARGLVTSNIFVLIGLFQKMDLFMVFWGCTPFSERKHTPVHGIGHETGAVFYFRELVDQWSGAEQAQLERPSAKAMNPEYTGETVRTDAWFPRRTESIFIWRY